MIKTRLYITENHENKDKNIIHKAFNELLDFFNYFKIRGTQYHDMYNH